MAEAVLHVENVSKIFGGLTAVDEVSLSLEAGEHRAIIGPNGAGKTTFFDLIGGQIGPTSGDIFLFGQSVAKLAPRKRAKLGLARTFQSTNLFSEMTAEENIILSLQALSRIKYVTHRPMTGFAEIMRRVDEIIEKWGLSDHRNAAVGHLSYGVQRQLEIILALESSPRLLLLDEPTAGLAPAETQAVTELIGGLDRAITVLLIEHDMDVAFEIADRFTVFHQGKIVVEGTPQAIRENPRVAEIYLGEARSGPGATLAAPERSHTQPG
jgi:branched-chain amino acid transport system ATP-binding protein